jgi:hypothetical protein
MKKYLLLALCMALIAAGAFAMDVGGGTLFGKEFGGRVSDFGLYGFIGWKYMDINLGVTFRDYYYAENWNYNSTLLRFGLDFKLPITVASFFRFYPTIGGSVYFLDDIDISLSFCGGLGADVLLYKNLYAFTSISYNFINSWNGGFLFKLGAGWML